MQHTPASAVVDAVRPVFQSLEGRVLFAAPTPTNALSLEVLGTYGTGLFDEGAAEIVAYDRRTEQAFSVNAQASSVDILDLSDPNTPTLVKRIDVSSLGGPNSVAVNRNVVAVAIENDNKQLPGVVAFFKTNGQLISTVPVGSLPDMLTFTPDGRHLLVANEGEPNSYGETDSVDPEGSVSVISVPRGLGNIKKLDASDVKTADFKAYNSQADALRTAGVRIYGPGATVAQDFEPEYIAVSADSKTAYVTLQENNAIAVVDIDSGEVTDVLPLGYKDYSKSTGPGLDGSDKDGTINIANWPVFGMYQPDTIAAYTLGGQTYLVTANEGDAREYDGFEEEVRIEDLDLDVAAFPDQALIQSDEGIGRLNVTSTLGDPDKDGDYDALYTLGGRSFSIFAADGTLVFDSGDDFEQITAELFPAYFNSGNDETEFDSRSDSKGPEPEAITLGEIDGRTYAFIGLERVGGVMVYDITDPENATYVTYVNNRDFTADPETPEAGDLGPESITFIPAAQSPNGRPTLIVANEISGTVTTYAINLGDSTPIEATRADVVIDRLRNVFNGNGRVGDIANDVLDRVEDLLGRKGGKPIFA